MEKYYEKKAIRNGAKRVCKCGNQLSRYNQGNLCAICEKNKNIKNKDKILEIFNGIG